MRRTITILFFFFSFYAKSQVFTGAGGAIQNNGQETYFNLPVSGLSQAQLDTAFGIEEVCVSISHPINEQLDIYLESPAGNVVQLSESGSANGADYVNTCFDNQAATSITLANAPYSGSYRPIGYLGRFNNGQTGNGTWKLIVKDYLPFTDSGSVTSWSIAFGNTPPPPVIFTSSNLPIVIINTNNVPIGDFQIQASMGIINNGTNRNYVSDPWNDYNGQTKINLRGHSSKNYEKKPFSLETCDAAGNELEVSLLGMPAESDWVLKASYPDKTLMRDPLTCHLFRQMGHYSPRFKNVEVMINDEYRGVYTFLEKAKRDKDRIDVAKLTTDDNSYPEISGGYIFKIDRPDSPGWYSLFPGNSVANTHFYYQQVYPKNDSITPQQKNYIKSFVDSFETVMNSPSYADTVNGYKKYINVSSFIDYFLINELSKNVDAYKLSAYLYKDKIIRGGKLSVGPVWDYDIAWHNCNYGNAFDATGWQCQMQDTVYPIPAWWNRFLQDTSFFIQLHCRWQALRNDIFKVENLHAYIDAFANTLNESQQRNFTQWPILGAYIYPNPQSQLNANYWTEVNDLKNWISNRIEVMDAAIQGMCPLSGIEKDSVFVYPNPFQSTTTFELYLIKEAGVALRTIDVSLKIIDVMGKEIAVLLNEHKPSGEYKIIFNRQQTPPGIYFYLLRIDNSIKGGKIIIQ